MSSEFGVKIANSKSCKLLIMFCE